MSNNDINTSNQSSSTVAAAAAASSSNSLSFDDISKFFNMPIADAANILGVCSSVLKKICRDNGVVRWPYRKFLAGKTVEEIQKDAARERKKELDELSKATRQRSDLTSLVYSSTSGTQLQSKVPGVMNARPAHMVQNEGNRPFQSRPSNQNLHANLKDLLASLDEFKDGFPSNGLSISSTKWWGSSSSFTDGNDEEFFRVKSTNDEVGKQHSQGSTDLKKDFADEVKPVIGTEASKVGIRGTALLLSVREKAAEEGREALKTGVHRAAKTSFKLRRREKLLLKVFKSSLPSEWRFES